jgi:ABC-type glycerol-3-phosphate transport system substrate-binding protein
MRRLAALALVLSVVAAACGGSSGGGATSDQSALAPAKDVKPAAKIVWWHAMSGVNGDALNKIVDNFNKSQTAIKVETVFQGTYDDLLSKLNTALASNAAPAIAQVYDIGQAYMRASGEITPMQAFIDRDKFDTSDFEPAVINYYKYQDKLQSMPWNASSSILLYNKDAFKAAGLDPEKPPLTFSEVTDYAKKLTKKDASGQTKQYGFGPSIYGWLFEQLMATSGALYCDQGNGRDNRATKVVYNGAEGKAILDWWKAGVDGGYFYNPGIDNAGATNSFNAGKSAMYIESSASLRGEVHRRDRALPASGQQAGDRWQHHRWRVALHPEEPPRRGAAGSLGVHQVRDDPGGPGPMAVRHRVLPDREGRLQRGTEQGVVDQVPAVPHAGQPDPQLTSEPRDQRVRPRRHATGPCPYAEDDRIGPARPSNEPGRARRGRR